MMKDGRAGSRSPWRRLAGGVILGSVLFWVTTPYRHAAKERGIVRKIEKQVAAERRERNDLRADLHGLATEEGQEVEARRQGHIRPGERLMVFVEAGK